MASRKKLLIFIVAYNAASTIKKVLDRVPEKIFEYEYEILIIDDKSSDDTFERASFYKDTNRHLNLVVLFNPENQGYGGNQKIGYQYAIENKFDVVALLHGDGQYAPEVLEEMILPVVRGEADAVFGSRMARSRDALAGGMPLYKFVGNRILTFIQNRLLGSRLTEFHSGYRAYSVRALSNIPFQFNTNDFHFDTEIIIQLMLGGHRILEIPIPTYYGDEICYVNGLRYAKDVIAATIGVRFHQMDLLYRRQYDVKRPEHKYELKLGYPSSHSFVIDEVRSGSRVLDVGCGDGLVGRELEKKGCYVQGIDQAIDEESHPLAHHKKVDLDRDGLSFPPDDFDYILLLDIVEHLDDQFRLLDNVRARCHRKRPALILTVPNVAFVFIRLQLLLGNFNYGRRGILDFTHRRLFTFDSIRRMLSQSGYRIEAIKGIPAPYPLAIGDNFLSRLLLCINMLLIRVFPGLFSYQIYVRAVPLPTADQLLSAARVMSSKMSAGLGKQA